MPPIETAAAKRRCLAGGLAIVAVAYAVNAWFNHTAIGLDLKARGVTYVVGFFLLVGVALPALFLGWLARRAWASPRRLGADLGWRDAAATAVALAIGALIAAAPLAPVLRAPGALGEAHRLFALLWVASIAEVLIFLGAFGNAVQLATARAGRWGAGLIALVTSSLAYGFFHLTYPAPWNTVATCLFLTAIWGMVSLVFLASRSLLAAVVINNTLALVGFMQNRVPLPGTAAAGWLRAALAAALFALVFGLVRQASRRALTSRDARGGR